MKASGTIKAVARNGKSFMLEEDEDIWYSAPRGKAYDRDLIGAEVAFDYKENSKGDIVFYNVQGELEVEGGAPARPSRAPAARGKAVGGAASSGGGSDPRQQSIVRQNSLTQANMLYRTVFGDNPQGIPTDSEDMAALAEEVITIARIFEAYSMGEV